MKKVKKKAFAVAMIVVLTATCSAGLFQYCTAVNYPPLVEDTCGPGAEGSGCSGGCRKVVKEGYMECQSSINPWCGGESRCLYTTYPGSCTGEGCGCVYGDPTYMGADNECD